jgi:hypothetical protein
MADLANHTAATSADQNCTEQIELTPEEYERVRRNPTHFVVRSGEEHGVPEVERVVERP